MTHKWFKEDEHVYYGYVKEDGAIKVIWINPEEMELRSPAEEARRWGGWECEDVNEDIASA